MREDWSSMVFFLKPEQKPLALEFQRMTRGVPVSVVWKAMGAATIGVDWSRCSKTHMARIYATRGTDPGWGYPEGWRDKVKAALALKCKKE